MRFRAILGILLVLTSCSDSDMEYDYAFVCKNLDNPFNADYINLFFYIDLEDETVRNTTVVTDKGKSMNKQLIELGEKAFYSDLDYILPITKISNSKITFEDNNQFGAARFELDVSNLEMIYKSTLYNEDGSLADYYLYPERKNPLTNNFKCISVE